MLNPLKFAGVPQTVTGQLTDTPTRGLPTRRLDILRTRHSHTSQLADWTTRGLADAAKKNEN